MNENAKLLANLSCLMQGTNAAYAKQIFVTWLYQDGIVTHNLQALQSEADGHLALYRKKLETANVKIREFSRCECHQCWAFIFEGDRLQAVKARDLVWESAFECVGIPSVPPNLLEHGIQPPDIPTIKEHAAFIEGLQKAGLLQCSRMTREGQRRTKV